MKKTRLAEKRYRDKLKKDKKEIRLNTKKNIKNKIKELEKLKKTMTIIIVSYKKQKKTKLQKKKEYELNKRSKLIRKQNESNREKKQNERRHKRENMVDDINLGRFFALAASNKIYVNNLNLHEIKNAILEDYTGDFELIGKMITGPVEHKTNIRFKNMDDFERYINAIDVDYDSEDVIFTGYVYKLDTPQFKLVKRSAYGKGTNYMQVIVEYHGENCYIPTSGMCFLSNVLVISPKKITQKNF